MIDNDFGFEVDFLPIGEASRSGDAICIRWGEDLSNRHDRQFVMIIDCGYAYSADDVTSHIRRYYYGNEMLSKEETIIDVILSTHPHSDHFGGIPGVYANSVVKSVAMHTPWTHSNLPKWFRDGRVTANGIKKQLKEGLESAYLFSKKLAVDKIIPCELFAGESYMLPYRVQLDVWGPTQEYYDSLLPDFNCTPTKGNGIGDERLNLIGKDVPASEGRLSNVGDTSAENLSGIIFTLTMRTGEVLLFTGDAGIDSLAFAIKTMKEKHFDLSKLSFFQVPHHGSVQNLGPNVLTELLGTASVHLQEKPVTAYISVAASPDNSHPSRRVINALNSRNCNVYKTQGSGLQYYKGSASLHPGWVGIGRLENYPFVEG